MTTTDFMFDSSFLFGVVIVIFFFICHKKFGFYIFKIESEQSFENTVDIATTHCSDENCVRCVKYRKVLDAAASKISTIQDDELTVKIEECLQNGITQTPTGNPEQNPNVYYDTFLCGRYFWARDSLSKDLRNDVYLLETSYESILKEFKSVYNSRYEHRWKRNSTEQGSWDVFHLVNQGTFIEESCTICPHTTNLMKRLKGCMEGNVFGNILFSVVKPSTLIAPHYGPTNIRLRCHLGLVTTDNCSLYVGKEQRTWNKGQCIIFDDSFLHSVIHNGHSAELGANDLKDEISIAGCLLEPGDRAVFIIDLWHPEISHNERDILNFLFSPQLT